MFLAVVVGALVLCSVWPLLDAPPVLLVFEPLADVGGPIGVLVSPVSMRLIIKPLSLVDVAVSVDQCAMTIRLIPLPLPIIL